MAGDRRCDRFGEKEEGWAREAARSGSQRSVGWSKARRRHRGSDYRAVTAQDRRLKLSENKQQVRE